MKFKDLPLEEKIKVAEKMIEIMKKGDLDKFSELIEKYA